MPRMMAGKRSELESFWRAHLDGWRRSDLNQREYCELHGLPLKRFGNWRAKLKHEEPASAGQLPYRRVGGLRHMSSHMTKEIVPPQSGYIPSARSAPPGARRRFSEVDKRRTVEEAGGSGATVSGVARRYGITARLLFRWKQELAPAAKTETAFLPVTLTDAPDRSAEAPQLVAKTTKPNCRNQSAARPRPRQGSLGPVTRIRAENAPPASVRQVLTVCRRSPGDVPVQVFSRTASRRWAAAEAPLGRYHRDSGGLTTESACVTDLKG